MSGPLARGRACATQWKSLSNGLTGRYRTVIDHPWSLHQKYSQQPISLPLRPYGSTLQESFRANGARHFTSIGLGRPRSDAGQVAWHSRKTDCAILSELSKGFHNTLDRRKVISTWRCVHTKAKGGAVPRSVDGHDSSPSHKFTSQASMDKKGGGQYVDNPSSVSNENYLSAHKSLMDRLPNMPHLHRPTKEELLAAATGFWSRLKIRFKWSTIRSARPFNSDEIGAFFSWVVLGHVLWIILGTTTFFSLAIFALNTVFAQETLARWVGNYLTKSTGLTVVFESAIVPRWGNGVITFNNVFVSKRPGQGAGKVSKGSPETAAAAAAATAMAEKSKSTTSSSEMDDGNYTQFDVSIETANVTLSFTKWFNSKGLLQNVEVKGVRGVIDRTHVHWTDGSIDPKTYRHQHQPGDFEIDSFQLEDLLVTVHQPDGFRPFSVSIFSCNLPRLRRRWLFYDFLCADTVSGSFDESLFTIHPRQMHGYAGLHPTHERDHKNGTNPWKKHTRLRIDGLNIDHLNRGVEGPFSWIHEGHVDIVADVMFPADNDESIAKVVSDFYDRLEATVTSRLHIPASGDASTIDNDDVNSPVQEETAAVLASSNDDRRFVVFDLKVHLNDIRAAVPLFTRDLSYIKSALIRPIVAYLNSRRNFIPINCRVVKRATDFDGSWTLFDSGLMHDLSAETYTAIAKDVMDDQAKLRRFKKVGLWSLQLAVQALFMGMAGNVL